jgi:hypothetical protein
MYTVTRIYARDLLYGREKTGNRDCDDLYGACDSLKEIISKIKLSVRLFNYAPRRGNMVEWRYISTILDLRTRWRGVVIFTPRLLYPRRRIFH